MKTVIKSEKPLASLFQEINNTIEWNVFVTSSPADYQNIMALAKTEQNNECAYTGIWIGEGCNTPKSVHLDHFRKREHFKNLTFNWQNIFAAIHATGFPKEKQFGADYKDSHFKIDSTKTDKGYEEIYSPLEKNLQDKFWYNPEGKAEPRKNLSGCEWQKVKNTIDIFNLNHTILKNERKRILTQVRNSVKGGMTESEIKEIYQTSGFSEIVDFALKNP